MLKTPDNAVGCLFCMTGRDGLLRQLASAEIVAQVVLARARRTVKRVVFMGMGEPAHNLDNVLEAIDLLGTAGGIGHKNLVFSTVGDGVLRVAGLDLTMTSWRRGSRARRPTRWRAKSRRSTRDEARSRRATSASPACSMHAQCVEVTCCRV